jgi:membrane protein DedA with SNARE-associated domain
MPDFFEYFEEWIRSYGYPILFAGVMLENAGIPVPGETAVLAAGFLASQGYFAIVWVMCLTACAAIIGDNAGFWIGHRWARPWLQRGKRFLFLTPTALALAEDYFHRYGSWTIFFARFITGIRVVGALAAGTAGMHWSRFLVANALGACLWASTISLVGYFFGQHWQSLEHWLGRGGLIAFVCAVVFIYFVGKRAWGNKKPPIDAATRSEPEERPASDGSD